MRVAADIVEYLLRTGEGRFRVDDPVGLSRWHEVVEKCLPIA